MLIGELSKKTGFSTDTIRFYEKNGLLGDDSFVRRKNKYKEYTDLILKRLLVIRDLKDFGFTLTEAREIISLYITDTNSCIKNLPRLRTRLALIENKITQLICLRDRLQITEEQCATNCKGCCDLNKSLQILTVR